jgi:cobalamin biosynthesis protein CobT
MTFCLTILFHKELLESKIETRKLLKECGYNKAMISSRSNRMTLISSDGTKYVIVDKDDVYDYDDDISDNNANEDEDDSYYYEVDDDSDADKNEEEGEGVEKSEAEEEMIEWEEEESKGEEEESEGEKEESEEEKNNEKQMPDFAIKMGQDLYVLRQHINKLPSPPFTNNCDILKNEEDYRKMLIN